MDKSSTRPVIVWFNDDLRLSDHPALHAASERGTALVCIYVLDEQSTALQTQARLLGAASRWWLAQSLRALQKSLHALGQTLVLRKGATATVLANIARTINASHVYWISSDIPARAALENDVAEALNSADVRAQSFPSDLLAHPKNLRNKDGRGLRVFTPFWKRVLGLGDQAKPLPAPTTLPQPLSVTSDILESWQLEPGQPDWAAGLRGTWTVGETAAQAQLADFLERRISSYSTQRDYPGHDDTSRLSPHLRFGEISPRQVWHAANFAAARNPAIASDVAKFLSELGWREFSRHLLFDQPLLAEHNLQPSFDAFPWRHDDKALRAWQQGRTGYPLVDAGMRELWHTGVMHNRVRMVTASFLVKHLLIDWREGEKWFWDTLVDADPGSNPANWQWVAGSGADAAPYFRIFNPVLQGEKFDPDGTYVSRWVPELARLPSMLIHKPWEATPIELNAAGVKLGLTYPNPIIEHKKARERALAAYAKIRN